MNPEHNELALLIAIGIVVAIVTVAMFLIGCGGSEPSSDTDASWPKTKQESFIRSCAIESNEEACRCMLDLIMPKVPFSEVSGEAGVLRKPFIEAAKQAADKCVKARLSA